MAPPDISHDVDVKYVAPYCENEGCEYQDSFLRAVGEATRNPENGMTAIIDEDRQALVEVNNGSVTTYIRDEAGEQRYSVETDDHTFEAHDTLATPYDERSQSGVNSGDKKSVYVYEYNPTHLLIKGREIMRYQNGSAVEDYHRDGTADVVVQADLTSRRDNEYRDLDGDGEADNAYQYEIDEFGRHPLRSLDLQNMQSMQPEEMELYIDQSRVKMAGMSSTLDNITKDE